VTPPDRRSPPFGGLKLGLVRISDNDIGAAPEVSVQNRTLLIWVLTDWMRFRGDGNVLIEVGYEHEYERKARTIVGPPGFP